MSMFVKIGRKSPFSGRFKEMIIAGMTQEEYNEREAAWKAGVLIQDAFPMLNADAREFIKTGITPDEWNEMFGKDE